MTLQKKLSLYALAWPIMVELLLQFMIGTVDTLMVSRISDNAAAVVGISNQFFNTAVILFTLINSGAGVLIAQKTGAGKSGDAAKAARIALVFSTLIGVVLSALLFFGARNFLALVQLPEHLLPLAEPYFKIVGAGMLVTSLNMALNSILRNSGDTRTPMQIAIGMNLLHILLNYGFIFGAFGLPQWGLTGVALSTVITRVLSVLLLYRSALPLFGAPLLNGWKEWLAFDKSLFQEALRIGMPMAFGSALWSLAMMVLYSLIATMGEEALAARTYMGTIESFPIMAGWSITMAVQIQVAHLYGAGDRVQAYRNTSRAFRVALILVMMNGVAMLLAIKPILHLFTSNERIVTLGVSLMLINMLFLPCKTIGMLYNGVLSSIGDTRYILILNMWFVWPVCIGLSYVLGIVLDWGVLGVYAAITIDEGARGLLAWLRWKRKMGTTRSVKPVAMSS